MNTRQKQTMKERMSAKGTRKEGPPRARNKYRTRSSRDDEKNTSHPQL